MRAFAPKYSPNVPAFFSILPASRNPPPSFSRVPTHALSPTCCCSPTPATCSSAATPGNIVPPFGVDSLGGVSATIEYAVLALGIESIIVCGHSDCGAMKAVLSGQKHETMPTVDAWLSHADPARQMIRRQFASSGSTGPVEPRSETEQLELLRALTRANVIAQLKNLQTHPSVAAGLAEGRLSIYGWVYEIHTGQIQSYDGQQGRFFPLSASTPTSVIQPRLHLMAS